MNVDDMPLPSDVFKEADHLEELILELITQRSHSFVAKFQREVLNPFCDEYGLRFVPPDSFYVGNKYVDVGMDRIPKPNRPDGDDSDKWWFPVTPDQQRISNLLSTPFGLPGSNLASFMKRYDPLHQ